MPCNTILVRISSAGLAFLLGSSLAIMPLSADMIDMTGVEPQHVCAECHGLDGAGNRIKFPRLAGQKVEYIIKQLDDFRAGRRKNDGGQMQETVTELEEKDTPRVAEWFSKQDAPWPGPTLDGEFDLVRARQLATAGEGGAPGCLACHSATSPYLYDRPVVAPRVAGQHDHYIAKQLKDFRTGRRDNDADGMMRKAAAGLTDAEILSLAAYLSQNPALHDAKP